MSAAPYILSADIATHTGICEGRAGEAPKFYTLDFSKGSGARAPVFGAARRWCAHRFGTIKPDVIYIEAPLGIAASHGQTSPETIFRLFGLAAVFLAEADARGIRIIEVDVQTARGAFLGQRTIPGPIAKKRAAAMCAAIGWTPNTADEADAGCVHYYAMLKEAPNLAPLISAMTHHQIATQVETEAVLKAGSQRQRAIEIAEEKAAKARRKAERAAAAEAVFRGRG